MKTFSVIVKAALTLLVTLPGLVQAIRERPKEGTFLINVTSLIDVPIEEAFAFASDPQNDPVWRFEAKSFRGEGESKVGKYLREYINLGMFLPYIMSGKYWEFPMEVTTVDKPYRTELYTHPDYEMKDFYLHVVREFKVENGKTRMNWSMEVDVRIPPFLFIPTFGFTLPTFMVNWSFILLEGFNIKFPLKRLMESGKYKKLLSECEECKVTYGKVPPPPPPPETKEGDDKAKKEEL